MSARPEAPAPPPAAPSPPPRACARDPHPFPAALPGRGPLRRGAPGRPPVLPTFPRPLPAPPPRAAPELGSALTRRRRRRGAGRAGSRCSVCPRPRSGAPPDWLGPRLSSPFRPPAGPLPPPPGLLLPPPAEPSPGEKGRGRHRSRGWAWARGRRREGGGPGLGVGAPRPRLLQPRPRRGVPPGEGGVGPSGHWSLRERRRDKTLRPPGPQPQPVRGAPFSRPDPQPQPSRPAPRGGGGRRAAWRSPGEPVTGAAR